MPQPRNLFCENGEERIDVKDYEVETSIGCHVFLDAESYDELLAAILKWWSSIDKLNKTLEAITFTIDDDGVKTALVHWNYFTKEEVEKVDRELLKLRPLPLAEPETISGN